MGRILDRYILREVAASWLAVTLVLLVILLTYQVTRALERAAQYQYPQEVVLQLIGLGALQNLSLVVPVGLLLGVMLAFGRLYHDSEMAAMRACGIGSRIYLPVAALALIAAAGLTWITLELSPRATARALELREAALRAGQFAPISPGRFRSFGGGGAIVYAQNVNADGTLANVFVERSREGRVEVAVAQRARHVVAPDGMVHTITLYDGERFEGVPGSPEFRIVRFAEHVIPVKVPELSDVATALEGMSTRELLASSDPHKHAELHWRISLPVMCLVLTLLAVPLSRLRPRQGRYARVWLGVLIYFVYSNLIVAGKVGIERGMVPEGLGLWWVHLAVLAMSIAVILGPGLRARARHRG